MSRKKMQKELFDAAKMRALEEDALRRAIGMGAVPASLVEGEASRQGNGKGILPFRIEAVPDGSDVTPRAGLTLATEAMRGYGMDKLVEQHVKLKERDRGFAEWEISESVVLLQVSGGEHMEDIEVLRQDGALCRMVGREFPSPDVLRNYLVAFHDEKLIDKARKEAEEAEQRSYVPEESQPLRGVGLVLEGLMRRMADPALGTCATLDHDATLINSEKRTATYHYKGEKGYQPVAVVWAEQNLAVADEFRDGNVPADKDNLRLIRRAFEALPDWVTEYRFRADSACYEEKVLKWLASPKREGGPRAGVTIGFTISSDMTVQLRAECEKVLEPDAEGDQNLPCWQMLDDTRADETAEWSEVEFTPGNWPKDAQPLRYIVVRFMRRQMELYADGSRVRYLGVVSNLESRGDELLRWHWKKAGTIEHFHDETKNGLGAGVLPCEQFGANAAWYRHALIAYNVTTVLRRHALPPEMQDARLKRLRFLLVNVAARLTTHARYLVARLYQSVLRRVLWLRARDGFLLLRKGLLAGPAP